MKNEKSKKGKAEGKAKESKEIKVSDEGVVKGSTAKAEFKAFIEKHRLQNPVKYEINKAQLEKQLSEIK